MRQAAIRRDKQLDFATAVKQSEQLVRKVYVILILTLYGSGVFLAVVTSVNRLPTDGYYVDWGREYSYFTFGSSLQYFLAAQAAFLCFWVSRYYHRHKNLCTLRASLWLAASLAFIVATFDELFMIHEKALTALDRANPWLERLYFNAADDMFVITCAIGAVIFTFFIFRELWTVQRARWFYAAGLFLLIFAGLLDYLPHESFENRLPLGLEELSEYFAGVSFAAAFLLYAMDRFRLILIDWLYPVECLEVPENLLEPAAQNPLSQV